MFISGIKRFFSPLKQRKWVIVVGTWVLILSCLHIFEVKVWKETIKNLELWNEKLFLYWLFSWIVFAIVVWILWFWRRVKTEEVLYQTIHQTYKHNIPIFIELDQQKIEKMWIWRIQTIFIQWIDTWWRLIYGTIYDWIYVFITITFSIILLFGQNTLAGFVWILTIILFLSRVRLRNKWEKKKRVLAKNEHITLSRAIIRQVMNKAEILQTNKIEQEILAVSKIRDDIITKEKNLEKYKYTTYHSMKYISIIVGFVIWIFIWLSVLNKETSISNYVFVIWLFGLISGSIRNISERLRTYTRQSVDVYKLWELYDSTETISNYRSWKIFSYKKWEIAIKNLFFSYEAGLYILQNFNLKIEGWKKTAIVWLSWWWKSTILKLLAGYLRPDSWEIEIDWQKLSEVKLIDYYKHIGYLTQDPSVFDGTIYENLVYALEQEPPQEELEKIIKLAKCEFIRDFEKWLETEIWEKWIRLSGGQRQRLAIAKIMLKNPQIILLDEPTSALDSVSEQKISEALHNLFRWKTVIVIAHRLQTVKEADEIIVLDRWNIVERWNHQQLKKLWWLYKQMLDLQTTF